MPSRIGNRSGIWPANPDSGRAWNACDPPWQLSDAHPVICEPPASLQDVRLLEGLTDSSGVTFFTIDRDSFCWPIWSPASVRNHPAVEELVWVASYTDSATCKAVTPFGFRLPGKIGVEGDEDSAVRGGIEDELGGESGDLPALGDLARPRRSCRSPYPIPGRAWRRTRGSRRIAASVSGSTSTRRSRDRGCGRSGVPSYRWPCPGPSRPFRRRRTSPVRSGPRPSATSRAWARRSRPPGSGPSADRPSSWVSDIPSGSRIWF